MFLPLNSDKAKVDGARKIIMCRIRCGWEECKNPDCPLRKECNEEWRSYKRPIRREAYGHARMLREL